MGSSEDISPVLLRPNHAPLSHRERDMLLLLLAIINMNTLVQGERRDGYTPSIQPTGLPNPQTPSHCIAGRHPPGIPEVRRRHWPHRRAEEARHPLTVRHHRRRRLYPIPVHVPVLDLQPALLLHQSHRFIEDRTLGGRGEVRCAL